LSLRRYDNVKATESAQSEAAERQQEEKKTERDIAIEKANEIMERVVLEGGGECDWAGCREALGAVYEEGGLGFFAKVVRG
jgi:hypothetical protein